MVVSVCGCVLVWTALLVGRGAVVDGGNRGTRTRAAAMLHIYHVTDSTFDLALRYSRLFVSCLHFYFTGLIYCAYIII